MTNDVDSIVNSFPHPTVDPIQGLPTFATLSKLQRTLSANAAAIHSKLGTGRHGHLALTVSANTYLAETGALWRPPVNPENQPDIPRNASAEVIATIERTHKINERVWERYNNVDQALKQQLIGAVEPMYIQARAHRTFGFATVTTLELLDHLFAVYGKITARDLDANHERLRKAFDPSQAMEVLVDQVEDAVAFAKAAETPYTDPMVVSTAFTILQNTGVYPDAIREWKRKEANDRTWANFKLHFAAAHEEYRDSFDTAQSAGYHTANHAQQELQQQMLAHLATVATSDSAAIAQLQQHNHTLHTELLATNTRLEQALAAITTIAATQRPNKRAAPTASTAPPPKQPKLCSNTNYCWTHGWWINDDHTSASCTKPAAGHQTTATRNDTKGGSTKNKERALRTN